MGAETELMLGGKEDASGEWIEGENADIDRVREWLGLGGANDDLKGDAGG